MKTYKVYYTETIKHVFYVDAESADEVEAEFYKLVDNHVVDFSDGEFVDSEIYYEEINKRR